MNKEQLLNELRTHHFPEKIINAFKKVPREDFIPAHKKEFAYENHALPIGYEQTISQPYTIAVMLDMLDLKKGQKVLEVGSGCGYVLALISEITKSKVYGVEVVKELARKSKKNLKNYNVEVYNRNGKKGLKEKSPFEGILISAACKKIPKTLLNQLADNGILVAPVGPGKECTMTEIQRQGKKFIKKELSYPKFGFVKFV